MFFRAFNSVLVRLLCGGSQALWTKEAVVVRMASFKSSGRRTMAATTSETISLTEIVRGVGAKFGPFSRRERSTVESGFCDKLIIQFFLLIAPGRSLSTSIPIFVHLFSCLASMLLRTDWDLLFRNCSGVDEMSSVTKPDSSCLVSSEFGSRIFLRRGCTTKEWRSFFFGRISVTLKSRRSSQGGGGAPPNTLHLDPPWLWQIEIASLIACSLIRLQIGWLESSGLSIGLWVKRKVW